MMTTLEYRYGGPPLVSEQTTFTEYLYVTGKLPPRHPMPALADTAMVLCLTIGAYNALGQQIVWDEVWQDNVPAYVPFVCPL